MLQGNPIVIIGFSLQILQKKPHDHPVNPCKHLQCVHQFSLVRTRLPSKIYLSSPPDDLTDDQIFKIFDKNGDGFISSDEMQKLVVTFGADLSDAEVNELANELIKEADTSGDGRVSFEEFKEFKF